MRFQFRAVTILAVILATTACPGVLRVNEVNPGEDDLEGLPFYLKRAVCLQTTEYLETQTTATLTYQQRGREISLTRTFRRETGAVETDLAALRGQVAHSSKDKPISPDKIAWLRGLPPSPTGMPDTAQTDLVSNTTALEPYVDYSRQYTLNAAVPFSGSAAVTGELAPDGTLSKVEASADSRFPESVLAPASEVIKTMIPTDVATLEETERYLKHTLTAARPVRDSTSAFCPVAAPLELSDRDKYGYRRSVVPAPGGAQNGGAADRTVKVRGQIVLPNEKKP